MNKKNPSDAHVRWLHTRLTEAESHALDRLVKALGTTRAEFLRKVVREAAQAGPEPMKQEMAAFRDAVYQLGAVGRNFNQMVRAINSGDHVDPQQIHDLLVDIQRAIGNMAQKLQVVIAQSHARWIPHDAKAAA